MKFNTKEMSLNPNLVLNWMMLFGGFSVQYKTVSSNCKFRCFLIRILIRKDNTDNKVFKREFYTKETIKKEIEKIKCCKF